MRLDVRLDANVYDLHLARERKKQQGGTLKWGSRNARAIKAVQERLSQLGHPVEVDGAWGQETEAAFRAFQQSKGLRVDGILGKKSLAGLLKARPKDPNAADPSMDAVSRVVEKGGSQASKRTSGLGEARARQRGGGDQSTKGGAQGDASTRRERARARARKLTEDRKQKGTVNKGPHGGSIDPVTGKERATATTGPIGSTEVRQPSNMSFEEAHPRGETGGPTGGQFVSKGDTGEQVTNSQKAVNRVDKAGLQEDGDFGEKTDAAVRAYQKKSGLAIDGIVGPKTSAQLRRDLHKLKARVKPVPKKVGGRPARAEQDA